jgi:4-hydroxy-4-methyl-2-oxoglutarate aldolase
MDILKQLAGFDPATLYEANEKEGLIDPAIRPAWRGAKICGLAQTVNCPPGDNLMLHILVARAEPGRVIVANPGNHLLAAAWGEILTIAAQARGIAGLVLDGAVRDIGEIETLRFPVFSRGLALGSCTKTKYGELDVPIQLGGATVRPGDIVVGGPEGLVVIACERAEKVYRAAASRRERETEIIRELRRGRTTLELLDLPDLPENSQMAKNRPAERTSPDA